MLCSCQTCQGNGVVLVEHILYDFDGLVTGGASVVEDCRDCLGQGIVEDDWQTCLTEETL